MGKNETIGGRLSCTALAMVSIQTKFHTFVPIAKIGSVILIDSTEFAVFLSHIFPSLFVFFFFVGRRAN